MSTNPHRPSIGSSAVASRRVLIGLSSARRMLESVETQVIGARKTLVALGTLERFLPRVSAIVSSQLIGATEGPVTLLPGTLERLFARVHPLVGLQVRALGVHLVALRVVTLEHPLPTTSQVGAEVTSCRGGLGLQGSVRGDHQREMESEERKKGER